MSESMKLEMAIFLTALSFMLFYFILMLYERYSKKHLLEREKFYVSLYGSILIGMISIIFML